MVATSQVRFHFPVARAGDAHGLAELLERLLGLPQGLVDMRQSICSIDILGCAFPNFLGCHGRLFMTRAAGSCSTSILDSAAKLSGSFIQTHMLFADEVEAQNADDLSDTYFYLPEAHCALATAAEARSSSALPCRSSWNLSARRSSSSALSYSFSLWCTCKFGACRCTTN